MKKVLLLSLLVFAARFAQAQNNLQFSQVLTYADTVGITLTNSGGVMNNIVGSVPLGKVWKVENFYFNTYAPSGTVLGNGFGLCVNNIPGITLTNNGAPIWLKGGDFLEYSINNYGVTSAYVKFVYFYSIIEYTIVP